VTCHNKSADKIADTKIPDIVNSNIKQLSPLNIGAYVD